MAADGLDGLIVMSPANLHYLSGILHVFGVQPDRAGACRRNGDAGVVTASCEIPAAVLSGWVEDVVSFAWDEGGLVASKVAAMLEARGTRGVSGLGLRWTGEARCRSWLQS